MLPATIGWQRDRAAIDFAITPYCQSPVNTLPPVRTGDGEIFIEATQRVHWRRRSRRMVRDSLRGEIWEQYFGLNDPIFKALSLLTPLGGNGFP